MINDIEIARSIHDLMLEIIEKVNESIILVQDHCSDREFKSYRRAAAYVIGYAHADVVTPLYQAHPSLAPDKSCNAPLTNTDPT